MSLLKKVIPKPRAKAKKKAPSKSVVRPKATPKKVVRPRAHAATHKK